MQAVDVPVVADADTGYSNPVAFDETCDVVGLGEITEIEQRFPYWKEGNQVAATFEKASISTEAAHRMISAAEARATEMGVPMVIAVVDDNGVLKAFSRMDGAALLSVQVAQDKAYTSVGFGLATHEFHDFVENDEQLRPGARTGIDRLVTFGGGYPLKVDGRLVGGIGTSGGHWSQDMQVAEAGLAALS